MCCGSNECLMGNFVVNNPHTIFNSSHLSANFSFTTSFKGYRKLRESFATTLDCRNNCLLIAFFSNLCVNTYGTYISPQKRQTESASFDVLFFASCRWWDNMFW